MSATNKHFLTFFVFVVSAVLVSTAWAQTTRIRLMGANITSGNQQSYDPGEGTRIFQGVDPDIVMIQEFNYGNNSTTAIRSFVDAAFGPTFSYYRQTDSGAQIPNGVISRYPILSSGSWVDNSVSNRQFVWAKIDIPGPTDLWAISVHLLTTSSTNRNNEATQLTGLIQANIPAADFVVIGGDFNTDSRSEACITTFSSKVVTTSPYPDDGTANSNKQNTNAGRSKPYDWVLADSDLNQYKTGVVIGSRTFTNGLVFDSRVYTPLSEVSPVASTDSGATNMQHMAIIRDFLVPSTGATATPSPTASLTPSPTVSLSPSATPSPSATAVPSPSPSLSPTPSPTLPPTAGWILD